MQFAPIEFTDWFNKLLENDHLGVREAARKIKISHPVVSDLLSGAKPTEGICVKIAIAYDFPSDYVLNIAGYRSKPKEDPLDKLIFYLAEKLPTKEDKQDAEQYLRLRLRIAEERGKYESADKKRAEKT